MLLHSLPMPYMQIQTKKRQKNRYILIRYFYFFFQSLQSIDYFLSTILSIFNFNGIMSNVSKVLNYNCTYHSFAIFNFDRIKSMIYHCNRIYFTLNISSHRIKKFSSKEIILNS